MALQTFTELQPFSDQISGSSKEVLDLSGAPVLFHLQSDPQLLEYIGTCENNVTNLDFKKVIEVIY